MSCNDWCFCCVNYELRTRSLSFAHTLASLANTLQSFPKNIPRLNITASWANAQYPWIGNRLSLRTHSLLFAHTLASLASTPDPSQVWSAQRKAAPCPQILGFSPQGSNVQAQDVCKEGLGVLASDVRAQVNESERVRGSQFTAKHWFNYKTWGHTINTCSYNQFKCN